MMMRRTEHWRTCPYRRRCPVRKRYAAQDSRDINAEGDGTVAYVDAQKSGYRVCQNRRKKLISFEPDETSYNLPTRKTNQGKFPLH
jgi:hypothetical protein